MKKLNISLFVIIVFTIFSLQFALADQTLDLSHSIREDNPSHALNLTKTMKHSSARYGSTQVDSYYSFETPKFTLLGFTLDDCKIILIENEISDITCHYKGEENNIKLNKLLTESLGTPSTIISDDTVVRWVGENEFHYELNYVGYSKTYGLSITNDTYRKFNKAQNGN